jgi:RND family efflux transporter MFP subunit
MTSNSASDTLSTKNASAPTPTESPAKASKNFGRRVIIGAALVAVVLTASFVAATLPRLRQSDRLSAAASRATTSPPLVNVIKVQVEPGPSERTLPGNAQANREAALYARTTGYLKQWLVDIGDTVTEGQLIAVIAAPDLDDQLAQARANLEQARATLKLNEANAALAETTMNRYVELKNANAGAISQLQIDEQQATVQTSIASVKAAQASIGVNEAMVQMYSDLQSFEKIVAPFAGVITARNVDPGALVTADNPSATRELFHLMQTDPLRVFVDVPQLFSTGVSIGQTIDVYRPEDPSNVFHGKVTRTANALDPNTRTLLTQIDVPNPDGALRPGMYLMVKFITNRATPLIKIPGAALVTQSDGQMAVGVLDKANAVHYRHVQLGRDFGTDIEVVAGLKGDETVIVHPGDALSEAEVVQPVSPGK